MDITLDNIIRSLRSVKHSKNILDKVKQINFYNFYILRENIINKLTEDNTKRTLKKCIEDIRQSRNEISDITIDSMIHYDIALGDYLKEYYLSYLEHIDQTYFNDVELFDSDDLTFDYEVGKFITKYLGEYKMLYFDDCIANISVDIDGYLFKLRLSYIHCQDTIKSYKSSLYDDIYYQNTMNINLSGIPNINNALTWFIYRSFNYKIIWRKEQELIDGLKLLKDYATDYINRLK